MEEDKIIETEQKETEQTNFEELLKGVDLNKLLEHESVRKLVQAQSDRRVTQALETAKAKWQQEQAQEQTEAEKLKKMTEDQRAKYELEKEKVEFEKQKEEFAHSQLVVETQKQLLSAGLPDIANFITGKNAEETTENIQTIQKILGDWKAEQLKTTMRGTVPKDTTPKGGTFLTREQINDMTTDEINKAWKAGQIDLSKI